MENLINKYNELKLMSSSFLTKNKLVSNFLTTSDLMKLTENELLIKLNETVVRLSNFLDLGIYVSILPSFIDILNAESEKIIKKKLSTAIPKGLMQKIFGEKTLEKV